MEIGINISGLSDQQKKQVLETLLADGESGQFPAASDFDEGEIQDDETMLAEEDLKPEELADEISLDSEQSLSLRAAAQEVYLGYEIDQCSGVLSVRNRRGSWIRITRGRWTTVDVAINGNGYWYWKCGNSSERSRGVANFRQRVKRLKVYHSTRSRQITWRCYDIL